MIEVIHRIYRSCGYWIVETVGCGMDNVHVCGAINMVSNGALALCDSMGEFLL